MPTVVVRGKAAFYWPGIFGYGGYYDYAWGHHGYHQMRSLTLRSGAVGQLYSAGQYECLQTVFLFDTKFLLAALYQGGRTLGQVTGAKLSATCEVDATDTNFTIEVRAIPVSDSTLLAYMSNIFSMFGSWSYLGFWNWYTKGTDLSAYPLVAHYDTTSGLTAGKAFDFINDSLISNISTNNITALLFSSSRQRLRIAPSGREWMSFPISGNTPTLTITYGGATPRTIGSSMTAAATLRKALTTRTGYLATSAYIPGGGAVGTKYGFLPARAEIWEGGETTRGFIATAEISPREDDFAAGFSPDFSGLAVL